MSDCRQCEWVNGYKSLAIQDGSASMAHAEHIATDHPDLLPPRCHTCKRSLAMDESAWASDWKVIDTSGTTVTFRMETRYTCDDCEAKR